MPQRLLSAAKRAAGSRVKKKPAITGFNRLGIMVTNYGSNTFTDAGKLSRTSLAVLSPHQTSNLAAFNTYWSTRSPKGRVIFYKTLGETASITGTTNYAAVTPTQTVSQSSRFANTSIVPAEEVKYHDANNPSDQWQLYSSGGSPLYWSSFSQSWLVDPAATSYQNLAYTYLIDKIQTEDWDGVFSDNISVSMGAVTGGPVFYRKDSGNNLVVAYSTPGSYADALISGVQNTFGRLKNDGYYTMTNSGYFVSGNIASNTGVHVQQWWARLMPHVSSCLSEQAVVASASNLRRSSDDVAFSDYVDGWNTNLHEVAKDGGGGSSHGMGSASATNDNVRYGIGLLRTYWDHSTDSYVHFFATNAFWPFPAIIDIDWGVPVGTQFTDGTGKLRGKRWTGAWAVVNTSRTQALSATWTDPLTGSPRSFTVQPIDAYLGA
jgi:hypothetical protein